MGDDRKILEALSHQSRPRMTHGRIADAMHGCYRNATELYEEARILLKNRRFARGFGLCVLCLEELAKIPLLANALTLQPQSNDAWNKFWRAFNSHRFKQNTWAVYGKRRFAGTPRAELYSHSWPEKLTPLERMKQLSFYVDFLDGVAMHPSILYSHLRPLCGLVLKMAEDRLEAFRPLHSTPERSKKVVKGLSRCRIVGVTEAEWAAMFSEGVDALTDLPLERKNANNAPQDTRGPQGAARS